MGYFTIILSNVTVNYEGGSRLNDQFLNVEPTLWCPFVSNIDLFFGDVNYTHTHFNLKMTHRMCYTFLELPT